MTLKLVSIRECLKSKTKKFDCGVDVLNEFLSRYALKNDELGIGKTFVAFDEEEHVAGYFTLSTAQVLFEDIPDDFRAKLPRYPIPALRIARLAVSRNLQAKGIGKWLLKMAFLKIIQVAEITGLYLIIVDAKESSRKFYEHYGFIKFKEKDLSYFLTVDTVKRAMTG
ncbi:MAG: GNAT family N-acetyltransferase [Sphaerochaetaceae bacterium]|nr:GNAT family N-acetyltransferase [Sphaerochaetaceae bacterium]